MIRFRLCFHARESVLGLINRIEDYVSDLLFLDNMLFLDNVSDLLFLELHTIVLKSVI